jgi:hypothetical protein
VKYVVLIFAAVMFTVIPWTVASVFWGIGDVPASSQFAPKADAVVERVEFEAAGRGRQSMLVWLTPVEDEAFTPGRRMIAGDLRSVTEAEVETVSAAYAPGTPVRVRVTEDALYPARMGFFDYAAWFVSAFCLFVGAAGVAGVVVSFQMVRGQRR